MDSMEQRLISWNSVYFVNRTTEDLNYGDKIKLPSLALEQLLSKAGQQTLPSPLTFQLRHPVSRKTVYCGVKEFSAAGSDQVELPDWILQSLELQLGDRVLIQLCMLPKGTWVQLKPISSNSREITDYRAALEAHLRRYYNTLTQGQVLSCHYGAQHYLFQVVQLKPEPAVAVNDTDLEVDIEGSVDISHLPTTHHLNLNQTLSHIEIPKNTYRYWKVNLSSTHDLQVKVKVEKGDLDVVTSAENQQPEIDRYTWGDLGSEEERTIHITPVVSDSIFIGLHSYEEDTVATLEINEWQGKEAMSLDENHKENHEGKVQCKNCLAWLPERTLILHEGFCYRNNSLCSWGCGRVFQKKSAEQEEHWHCDQCDKVGTIQHKKKHIEYQHTSKNCICKQFSTDSYSSLSTHQQSECSEKMIICQFCHILVAQGTVSIDARDKLLGLRSHESYCGSRTITCQKCNRPIPIKEVKIHAKVHDVKRQQQVLPASCTNMNCIRPRAKNRLSLCQHCFGPFWSTEDDPKNVKLIQKVARKIHAQFVTGCRNDWCRNEYCATYTKEPKDATTAASLLVPMIKNLPQELKKTSPNPSFYFCVDESITRKRFLAEVLQNDRYELGWCVKAIEQAREDLDEAKIWLDTNAPRKDHVL